MKWINVIFVLLFMLTCSTSFAELDKKAIDYYRNMAAQHPDQKDLIYNGASYLHSPGSNITHLPDYETVIKLGEEYARKNPFEYKNGFNKYAFYTVCFWILSAGFICGVAYLVLKNPKERIPDQINKNQFKVLKAAIVITITMFLFPPFQLDYKGRVENMGYEWIFAPPMAYGFKASVNIAMLAMQCVGVTLVCGVIFFLFKRNQNDIQSPQEIDENC